mgnify:CR=1 FL=1
MCRCGLRCRSRRRSQTAPSRVGSRFARGSDGFAQRAMGGGWGGWDGAVPRVCHSGVWGFAWFYPAGGRGAVHAEELLQHDHHKLHRRVVVIQHHYLVELGFLDPRLCFFRGKARAFFCLAAICHRSSCGVLGDCLVRVYGSRHRSLLAPDVAFDAGASPSVALQPNTRATPRQIGGNPAKSGGFSRSFG